MPQTLRQPGEVCCTLLQAGDPAGPKLQVRWPAPITGLALDAQPLVAGPCNDIWGAWLTCGSPEPTPRLAGAAGDRPRQRVVVKFLVDPGTRQHLTGRQVAATGVHSEEQLGKRRLWKDFCVPQLVEREIGKKPHLASYARHFPRTYMSTASPKDVGDEPVYTVLEHGGEDAETLTSFLKRRADILHNMKKYYSMCETFLRDACEALAMLHSMGWVHHDVWSDNFIVREDCSMWLVDFAGAHCLLDAEDLDFDRGSPHSRAIEAWWPTPTISAAYDVWGLGNLALFLCYRKQFWDQYAKTRSRARAPDDGEVVDMFISARFADFLRLYARMREDEEQFEAVLREIMGKRRTRQQDEASTPSSPWSKPDDSEGADTEEESPANSKRSQKRLHRQATQESSPRPALLPASFTTPDRGLPFGSKDDAWAPSSSPNSEGSPDPRADRASKKKSVSDAGSHRKSAAPGADRPSAERLLRFASLCFGPEPERRPSVRQLFQEVFNADDAVPQLPQAKTTATKTAVLRPVVAMLPGFYEA